MKAVIDAPRRGPIAGIEGALEFIGKRAQLDDILRHPDGKRSPAGFSFLHGYGHYHETYVRTEAGWRIKSVRLTRLYVESQ